MRRVVFLVAAVALVVVLATPATARTLSEVIPLGGTYADSVTADRSSCVGVLIPDGARKVSISVKLDGKSGLDPEFAVFAPDGSEIDPATFPGAGASLRIKAKKITLKNLPVGEGGLYKFVLRGKDGTAGDFVFKCRGKPAKTPKIEGSIDDALATKEHRIAVPDGAFLTVKLAPAKKSDLAPTLTVLTADGTALDTTAFRKDKGAKVALKKAPLPFFGGYVLRVGSAEGTGAYTLAVKIKVKKLKEDPTRPVADAGGVQVVPPGGAVGIPVQAGPGTTLMWTRVSGKGGEFSGPAATPTFRAPDDGGTHAFQLVAERNGIYSHADTAVVEVDQAPVAVGGASLTVSAGAAVTLDGSESFDLDSDDALAYSWQQVSGDAVTLAGAKTARPSFTAPATSGILVFELTVNDGFADSLADRIVVGVGRDVADAGRPVVVTPDDSVYLSGLRSPRNPDTFAWTRIDGNGATLTLAGADQPVAAFSAPRAPGTYRFRLTTDGDTAGADEILVIVTGMGTNGEPRAAAGGSTAVGSGQPFSLTGAASTDPDGDDLRYEWRQLDARRVILTGDGEARTGTAPVVASVLRFFLMVHDGRKYGPPDQATVVVGAPNLPVADAGEDATGKPGDTIVLDSEASTASTGRTITSRRWEQVSGLDFYDVAAEDGGFDPTAESPSFPVPDTGISSLTPVRSILFTLTVTDDEDAESGPDFVVVTFTDLPTNAAPEVSGAASTNRARPGTLVTLSGTATDRDGDSLAWLWTQESGPVNVTLSGATAPSASFTTPATSGRYIFRLSVDDGAGAPNSVSTIAVSVRVNLPPVISAFASPPAAPQGATVTLDGSGTTDPDGDVLTFFWQEVPTAGNPLVAILGQTTSKGTFTVVPYFGTIAARTRTYRLTVTDQVGPTQVTVTFVPNMAPAAGGLVPSKSKIRYDGTDSSTLSVGGVFDPDGDPTTIAWRIVAGPAATGATLSAATGATSTLTVQKPSVTNASTGGVWTVGATVSDGVQSALEQTNTVLAYPSWANDVWPMLSPSCSTTSCHGNANSSGGSVMFLGSTAATARGVLVNVNSVGSSNPRVTPNDHKKSYLWQQVNSGSMPKFGTKLAPWQINIIRDWIEPEGLGTGGTLSGGAENN